MSTKEKVKCAKSFIETLSKIGKTKLKKKILHFMTLGLEMISLMWKQKYATKIKIDYIK